MAVLSLLMAPHPAFRIKAHPVVAGSEDTLHLADFLCEQMRFLDVLALSAPMFGVSKCIIVVQEKEKNNIHVMFNPKVLTFSLEKKVSEEASPCYPGISAFVERPEKVCLQYYDRDGKCQELEVQGLLSTVIQHQMDYLEGKSFLDHLSLLKKNLLLKKMEQIKKQLKRHPHVHGPHCQHN